MKEDKEITLSDVTLNELGSGKFNHLDIRDNPTANTLRQSVQHRRLTVFEVKCGDIVQHFVLFDKDGTYNPHLEDTEVTMIYWNKGVTDYTDFYKKE